MFERPELEEGEFRHVSEFIPKHKNPFPDLKSQEELNQEGKFPWWSLLGFGGLVLLILANLFLGGPDLQGLGINH